MEYESASETQLLLGSSQHKKFRHVAPAVVYNHIEKKYYAKNGCGEHLMMDLCHVLCCKGLVTCDCEDFSTYWEQKEEEDKCTTAIAHCLACLSGGIILGLASDL